MHRPAPQACTMLLLRAPTAPHGTTQHSTWPLHLRTCSRFAFRPLGGSMTSLSDACRMAGGKLSDGTVVSHSRNREWGRMAGRAPTSRLSWGIQSPARWQFSRMTHLSVPGGRGAQHSTARWGAVQVWCSTAQHGTA